MDICRPYPQEISDYNPVDKIGRLDIHMCRAEIEFRPVQEFLGRSCTYSGP